MFYWIYKHNQYSNHEQILKEKTKKKKEKKEEKNINIYNVNGKQHTMWFISEIYNYATKRLYNNKKNYKSNLNFLKCAGIFPFFLAR